MSDRRYVLTIATGKKLYLDLALNLARSFFWRHADSDITFQLATDQPKDVPVELREKVSIIDIKPGEFGEGFSPKLFLDHLSSPGQTLFIDSDCLIFGDLTPVFEAFKGNKVSVVGNYIADGEWFGDIGKICKQFNVPHLPKFNGGIYYLEKGPEAEGVYTRARKIEKQYDEIGFVRLRNRPNDEVIMALAMQQEGMIPLIDDGTIMSDPQACPGGYSIDVITGTRWLINPPAPHPLHQNWYPFKKVSPLVVHFLGHYTLHYPYQREVLRLKKAMSKKLSWLTEFGILLRIECPARIINQFKTTFRPIYRLIAGYRTVKKSERI